MKTIHHLVDIDADVSTVWSALTVEEQMARWWSTKVEAPDAAVGTVVRWTFVDDFNPDMEIVAVDGQRELVWRCVGGHGPWADGTFNWGYYLESLRLVCVAGEGKPFQYG